jgi:uncharacterized protein YkwD
MRKSSLSSKLRRVAAAVSVGLLSTSLATAGVFKSKPCEVPGLREAMLQQVNQIRANGYRCGGQAFGAARPVHWNERLQAAAAAHSQDMAEHDYVEHVSPRGQQAAQRVDAAGYRWRSVAENIAAGDTTVQGVMNGWLTSASHCVNILDPGHQEIAVTCVARPGTVYGTYWTMVLARR